MKKEILAILVIVLVIASAGAGFYIGIAGSKPTTSTVVTTTTVSAVNIFFGVRSDNYIGGCLNVASIPLSLLKLDGVRLNPKSTTTAGVYGDNGTTLTLISGSSHVISADPTYSGPCNGCAECPAGGGNIGTTFHDWENSSGGSLGSSDSIAFTVASNGSSYFVAVYSV